MGSKKNRRQFLKTAALATGGIGSLLARPGWTAPSEGAQPAILRNNQLEADFCVVGAGYAGMAAAYRLQQQHRSVIVLEAGPRVGGRIWSSQLSDGTPFEIGGAWVADSTAQPNIRKLMKELGVGVYKQPDAGKNVFVAADGQVSQYDTHDPMDPLPPITLAGKVDLAAAILNLDQMSQVVHPDSPWDDVTFPPLLILGPQTTREADTVTVDTWLELNMHVPAAKAVLQAAWTGIFGLETWAVSLLHL